MNDVTPERVVLLLLDHDRDGRRAVQLQVEQGVALAEQGAEIARGHLEGPRIAAVAIDHAGHQAFAAQAAAGPRSEDLAGGDCECCAIRSHV